MNESPIYSRTYDLLLWLIPQAIQFPRQHRFGVGERVVRQALDFQDILVAAGTAQGRDRLIHLRQADTCLAQLRILLRLCKDMQLLTLNRYEHAARLQAEVGRLLGGWLKKET